MHIIIGIITAIAGLVWALHSLQNSGVDINSFNPFTWARRRKWEKLYGAKPLYNLEKPMDAAGALIVGLIKQEGEVTREQKQGVIQLFERRFHLNEQEAAELFSASSHLIKDEMNIDQSVKNILSPSISKFDPDMISSLLDMMKSAAELEGSPTRDQNKIIDAVVAYANEALKPARRWG
ncbi:MAG: phenylacetic acid degradation protein [Pseudomonadota bacterium]|nr:phenylacetic acid degradation protein [Pseudomonadota bacterium]